VNKFDRRTAKTNKLIKDSLLSIMEDKPFDKITIKEICEVADLNRGTFYLHFQDINQLLEEIHDDIFKKLDEALSMESSQERYVSLLTIFDFLHKNRAMVGVMLFKNSNTAFMKKLLNTIRLTYENNLKDIYGIENIEEYQYQFSFIIYGAIGIFMTWAENGMEEDTKVIASRLDKMLGDFQATFL
jgi:AcrR family transcriptional regulator